MLPGICTVNDDVHMIRPEPVHIKMEDVEEEINYWSSSLICYVVGANPPIQVMEGFVRRIWRQYGVDKVALFKRGVFLISLKAMDSIDKILEGHYFFDNKPVIVKAWKEDMDMEKEDMKTLSVWVQLKLHLKY